MKHRILALLLSFCLLLAAAPALWAADYTPEEQYQLLRDVEQLIRQEGLESYDDDDPLGRALITLLEEDPTLLDALLSEMLSGYDDYTLYIPAGGYSAAYNPETSYVGVGVTIQLHPQGALVTEVNLLGSAAAKGIRMGDVITYVADRSMAGLTLSEISDLLRGAEGTDVRVTLLRDGESFTVTLRRSALKHLHYSGAPLKDGIFYMKWSRIHDEGSYVLFRMQLAQLIRDGYECLILDLRDNPGGSLDLAFSIATDLIPQPGAFFRTAYRSPYDKEALTTRYMIAEESGADIPHLFVLVNGDSASSAEVIAASLRDRAGAVLIGETTYGKARGQQHFVLENDAGVVLTTMMLLPLEGEDYEGVGLSPQVEVHNTIRKGKDAIVVPTDVALAPYSCSDNGLLLNRALVALGLLEALPEKPYQVGEETLNALNRIQAAYQLNDTAPGAGVPTLLLVNQLLDAQLQGRYLQDDQLDTAILLAREVLAK